MERPFEDSVIEMIQVQFLCNGKCLQIAYSGIYIYMHNKLTRRNIERCWV